MKDDTISRQQFVDAFWKTEVEFSPSQIDEVMRILEQLPSAQPNTDHIYAELSKAYNVPGLPDEAIDIIGDLMLSLDEPSVQPEIIHCRECKYGDFCFQVGDEDGNGFCSDAERREDE